MNARRRSPGFTLIEMLVAMSIGVAVVAALSTLVALIMAFDRTRDEHLSGTAALARLGEQFRQDVHAGSSVALEPNETAPQKLRIDLADDKTGPGTRIEYEIVDGDVTRAVLRDGQVQSREAFVLGNLRAARWERALAAGEVALWLGWPARRDEPSELARRFSILARLPRVESARVTSSDGAR